MEEIIHLNEPEIKWQLEGLVREKVEETLNAMLCWMKKRTRSQGHTITSERRSRRIREPDITPESSLRKPGR